MKRQIKLKVGDLELAGDLFLPASRNGRAPAILMSQGFGAVKDMSIPVVAEDFAAEGFVVLLYDHRNFGESPGEPRQEVDAWQQVRDMREVISHLRAIPEVDPDRVGLWGTSFSISAKAAKEQYGVVLRDDLSVDTGATAALRSALKVGR